MSRTYKSVYTPVNEEKYVGDASAIIARSSWEARFNKFLDYNTNVEKWSSEELIIPYYYPLDGKMHRYFPDYWVKFKNGKEVVIEIKPFAETLQPIYKKGGNKRVFADRMATYMKNCAKWDAAKAFCEARGWSFEVFTEKTLQKLK